MSNESEHTFAADDYPIAQVPDDPFWTENYALTCNDPANGIGLMAFLGRWCGDPLLWREVVTIALPGDRIVCIKNYGRAATSTVASASMLRVETVRPGEVIRLVYDGLASEQMREDLLMRGMQPAQSRRCKFELTLTGIAPVWNMSGHAGKSTEIAGKLHIEQVGRGDGWLEFGGKRYEIRNAFTNRDHSRGVRVLDRFRRSCWVQGHFVDDDIGFNVFAVEMFGHEGLAMSNASVTQRGKRFDAKVKSVQMIEVIDDARRAFNVVIDSELGEMALRNVETLTSAPLSAVSPWDVHHGVLPGVPAIRILEEAVRWEWNGRQGLGWSERCFTHAPIPR